jgi:hypothetical protein
MITEIKGVMVRSEEAVRPHSRFQAGGGMPSRAPGDPEEGPNPTIELYWIIATNHIEYGNYSLRAYTRANAGFPWRERVRVMVKFDHPSLNLKRETSVSFWVDGPALAKRGGQ